MEEAPVAIITTVAVEGGKYVLKKVLFRVPLQKIARIWKMATFYHKKLLIW